MSPAFVGLQINFTTSCATVIFFSSVVVTWGSVWAKIQGVLKKAHRGTPCHHNRHTYAPTTANTVAEFQWRSETNQKKGQLVSPQMHKIMPFSACS